MSRAWDLVADLRRHSDVRSAEPALILPGIDPHPVQVFGDSKRGPREGQPVPNLICSESPSWSLELCRIPEAWNLFHAERSRRRGGRGIVVGHPDTGYTEHPEIFDTRRLHVERGFDFEDDKSDPLDPLIGQEPGHGTATASVIMSAVGSETDATEYVSGVAPAAGLIPIRVSTGVVHLSFRKLTKAIYHATDAGAHVISMSLGGPVKADYLGRAIQYATDQGVILLAAAGNRWPWVVYPARYNQVIAVTACNCRQQIWRDSASGPTVDVTAPGESVWRAEAHKRGRPFRVARGAGTSFAVAITAGACALWLSFHGRGNLVRRFGRAQLASVFSDTLVGKGVSTPSGWSTARHGAGILDAVELLQAPLPRRARVRPRGRIQATPRSEELSELDELAIYFPELDRGELRRSLTGLLRTDEDELDAVLSEFADELGFHCATNPELRSDIARRATSRSPRRYGLRRVFGRNPRFLAQASRRLRSHLNL